MENPIRILSLEDNTFDATLVSLELKKEYFKVDIKAASNQTEFEELLNAYSFDLVLADNNLPNYSGIQALQYTKSNFPDLPFIFVSGTLGEDKAILAIRYGASDFVDKNHLEKLGHAVRRVLNETNAKNQLINLNKAISESEERLSYVVKATHEMVWDMDMETEKIIWNTGGQNQFGYLPHQIENTFDWWVKRLHPDDKKKILTDYETFLASNDETWHGEYRFANAEGGYTWVSDSGCALRDASGAPYRVIGSMSDITILHKAQDELLISKQFLEESEKLKSSLLDNMNHELRTPMNGILGFADLLLDKVDNPEARIMVENIHYSGRRLLNTVKSIMDVAQLASGKYPINLNLTDLSLVISECIPLHNKMTNEKGLSLTSNIDNSVIANIDTSGLQNIINHLINNALKFTIKGGVEISTAYLKSGNESKPTIIIKDTGIGISHDKQKIIFQEFRQVSEGLDRSYQGNGLGLSIVQRIMELMQGEIKVESEPGVGSTFTLLFPSVAVTPKLKNVIDTSRTASLSSSKPIKVTPEELKILIVEDDMINADLTRFYLEGIASTDVAYDGESAIEKASQKTYQLILMDINLGIGIDGIETTRRIHLLNNYRNVPIIATTGYTLYNEIEQIKNSGFTDYLPKPFSRKDLLKRIKKNFLINQA